MLIKTGIDYFEQKNSKKDVPVILDTKNLINPHLLILGTSGTGKSHNFRSYLRQAKAQGKHIRFHVMDVHGDLEVPGASVVTFSSQAPYGLNPFVVNPDPEFGGVHRCINNFLRVVNQVSATRLGIQQEDCLRSMILDVFEEFGFDAEDASTWSMNAYDSRMVGAGSSNRVYLEVPIAEKDEAKAFGARWDGDRKLWWIHTENYKGDITRWKPAYKARTYPTLRDISNYAKELYEQRFLGSDQKAVRALQEVNKAAQAHLRATLSSFKDKRLGVVNDDLQAKLEEAKANAIFAYTNYVNSIRTGREFELLQKYQDPVLVRSCAIRIRNLLATGVYKDLLPNFDPDNAIWRYKLDPFEIDQKQMFVLFKMSELFAKAVQRGMQDDVVEIIVLDELGMYTSSADGDKGTGIIGTIAREARKYGLALWAATQTVDTVPESLLSAVATLIILGVPETKWKQAESKFAIKGNLLSWIQPQATAAIQFKEKRSVKNTWRWVVLDRD